MNGIMQQLRSYFNTPTRYSEPGSLNTVQGRPISPSSRGFQERALKSEFFLYTFPLESGFQGTTADSGALMEGHQGKRVG
jgi:hypothetical protein